MAQQGLADLWRCISPISYLDHFAHPEKLGAEGDAAAARKKVLVIHAKYDLTFREEFSLQVLDNFRQAGLDFVSKVLPCGHYTTGETPYKFIDGWYLGSFVYSAFKEIASERSASAGDERARTAQLVAD
jgi:hypothetical protein